MKTFWVVLCYGLNTTRMWVKETEIARSLALEDWRYVGKNYSRLSRMGNVLSRGNNYCSGQIDQKARLLLRAVLYYSFGQFPKNAEAPRDHGNRVWDKLSDYTRVSAQGVRILFSNSKSWHILGKKKSTHSCHLYSFHCDSHHQIQSLWSRERMGPSAFRKFY